VKIGTLKEGPGGAVTRLFLARHGSTDANERLPFVLQGSEIDGDLTETGRKQAAALAHALADFEFAAIYSSPMRRARQTAEAVALPRGQAVIPLPDLRECSVGRWEGLSWEEIKARDAEGHRNFFADPVNNPHPGGESYRDVLHRARPAIEQLLVEHAGGNILVVAHNMVNRVFLAEHVGIDLKHARKLRQTNCCINLLQRIEGAIELITLNSVLHLDYL
jgi:broad specificity phosphatase PhoE